MLPAACGGEGGDPAGLGIVEVARGFVRPVYVTAPASEPKQLYVVERRGTILVVEDGKTRPTPFLDIRDRVRETGFEQGLLSVAFHPDYARNHRFYVDYTGTDDNVHVVEFRSRDGQGVRGTARELLMVRKPTIIHNGGQLQFGPDGKLYVSVGDGGQPRDPNDNAQNPSSHLGKLLRTDPLSVAWEPAGYGLRNPWRFSFDRETGDLYIGDVGRAAREELNFRPRGAPPANYGWARYEGTRLLKDIELDPPAPVVFPIFEYCHTPVCLLDGPWRGISIIAGYVYRGRDVPAARGRFFAGDWGARGVASMRVTGGKATDIRAEPFHIDQLTSFGEDAEGELYLVSGSGVVYRLTP